LHLTPVKWENDELWIIDQTLLPEEYRMIRLDTVSSVAEAIKSLRVRGAPAIGVCAAYGVVVAFSEHSFSSLESARKTVLDAIQVLSETRPTAYNLFWALDRMRNVATKPYSDLVEFRSALLIEARAIFEEDVRRCRSIGENGADLVPDGGTILTHCNAGALATSSYGTALSVLYAAQEKGKTFKVLADETRPLLQGARLTAWELHQAGIDVTVICDSAAAFVMSQGWVQMVVVGADRIAANGDTANKVGTYAVAVAAHHHRIPFYVAAPISTIDLSIPNGEGIPIEQRSSCELADGFVKPVLPKGVAVYNPAFDVTPAALITGIITECGVLYPPYDLSLRNAVAQDSFWVEKHLINSCVPND